MHDDEEEEGEEEGERQQSMTIKDDECISDVTENEKMRMISFLQGFSLMV
jgi:hypothetical protein